MKSTQAELEALLGAFQLPTLHPDIPINPIVTKHASDVSLIVRNLVSAKVIQPADIPPTATRSEDILHAGLGAWLRRRTSRLQNVRFSVALNLDKSAELMAQLLSRNDKAQQHKGEPVLVFEGAGDPYYRMDGKAAYLERVCPGLFKSALDAVALASYRTVQLRLPMELYEHVCYMYWECDTSENISDREARKVLKDRFGGEDGIDDYLPSKVRPLFGGNLCCSWWSFGKRKLFGPRKLARIASTSDHAIARKVALKTIELRKALKAAELLDARLPDLDEVEEADPTCPAATLLFKPDDLAFQAIDDLVNDAWNSGTGTDMIGIGILPTSTEDLRLYFNKLDAAFNVLKHMDSLIGLIATKYRN